MLTPAIIGNKIAEARKKKNISQANLAGMLFVSPQAVGKWERGESMPDIISLNRLAEVLGVDLNYFSEGNEAGTGEKEAVKLPETQADEISSGEKKGKPGWDMSRGNWVDADFSGLKNLHEKFSSSNLQRCKFVGSDLSGLLLKGNHVVGCDFSESDFSKSNVKNSYLDNNTLKDCILLETEFTGSHIRGCDFSGADFTGVKLTGSDFTKNKLENAVWKRTFFNGTQLSDIVFGGEMEDCSFEGCAFKKVTFREAKLINTFFKNKSLKGIRFIDCQADRMTYEFLKSGKADLDGVVLVKP